MSPRPQSRAFLRLGRSHDGAAYDFRDLRDDGVAEGSKAVHPSGNPMSHSTHVGFRQPPTAVAKPSPDVAEHPAIVIAILRRRRPHHTSRNPICLCTPSLRVARSLVDLGRQPVVHAPGVGHDPDPVASVRRTNGGSRNTVPFRIIPERG